MWSSGLRCANVDAYVAYIQYTMHANVIAFGDGWLRTTQLARRRALSQRVCSRARTGPCAGALAACDRSIRERSRDETAHVDLLDTHLCQIPIPACRARLSAVIERGYGNILNSRSAGLGGLYEQALLDGDHGAEGDRRPSIAVSRHL